MASKLAAAKMAAWSGVRTVIAAANREGVLAGAVDGSAGVGTVVRPRATRLPARKHYSEDAATGRGLLLVETLADGWGANPTAGGKAVWFELGVPA